MQYSLLMKNSLQEKMQQVTNFKSIKIYLSFY